MAQPSWLSIEGARQNNLKNVSVAIPHDRLTVITGVSGSGKSSLAFDTLFAEGQWRYIESLSTYARMFIERLDRPDVDRIDACPTRHRAGAEEPGADGPLHRRDRDRGPRLPAPPVGADRPGALPSVRERGAERHRGQRDRCPRPGARRGPGPHLLPPARRRRRRPAHDRARPPPPRLRAGQGRRGRARAGRGARAPRGGPGTDGRSSWSSTASSSPRRPGTASPSRSRPPWPRATGGPRSTSSVTGRSG